MSYAMKKGKGKFPGGEMSGGICQGENVRITVCHQPVLVVGRSSLPRTKQQYYTNRSSSSCCSLIVRHMRDQLSQSAVD